jgi:transposase
VKKKTSRNGSDVPAYLGLVPRRQQPGSVEQQLRISKAGNKQFRSLAGGKSSKKRAIVA